MELDWRFDFWFKRLPKSPQDRGLVKRLVIRPGAGGHGAREIVDRVTVTVEGGIEGDRWSTDPERTGADQVSLINIHVLESFAGTDPDRCAESGDNLHVDLDLSEENLPAGTRLAIGTVELRVSEQQHVPCKHFHQRYGVSAVKKVLRANKKGRRGRGVICTTLKAGKIHVGNTIYVLRNSHN